MLNRHKYRLLTAFLILNLCLFNFGFACNSTSVIQSNLIKISTQSDRVVDVAKIAFDGTKSIYESNVINAADAKPIINIIEIVNDGNGKLNKKLKEWIADRHNPVPVETKSMLSILEDIEKNLLLFEVNILPKIKNERARAIALQFLIGVKGAIATAKTIVILTEK